LWNDSCQCSEQFLRNRAKRHCPELYRPRCVLPLAVRLDERIATWQDAFLLLMDFLS
jgi:hypothetical protein